jgi:hypothetical protein
MQDFMLFCLAELNHDIVLEESRENFSLSATLGARPWRTFDERDHLHLLTIIMIARIIF